MSIYEGSIKIYKYDSNNNLIEKTRYNSDGSPYESYDTWKITYKYDSNNNLIEEIRYRILTKFDNTEIKPYYKYVNKYEYYN